MYSILPINCLFDQLIVQWKKYQFPHDYPSVQQQTTHIGNRLTNDLWAHNWILWKFLDQINSQFCTCHDRSAVMTCAKLQSDWIIIFQVRPTNIFFKIWIMSSYPVMTRVISIIHQRLHITVMSHECHGFSNYRQLDCLFNRLFKVTTKETSKLHITGYLCGYLCEEGGGWGVGWWGGGRRSPAYSDW